MALTTGKDALESNPTGRIILTVKQSSDESSGDMPLRRASATVSAPVCQDIYRHTGCKQDLPKFVALNVSKGRTVFTAVALSRRLLTGGSANGIPVMSWKQRSLFQKATRRTTKELQRITRHGTPYDSGISKLYLGRRRAHRKQNEEGEKHVEVKGIRAMP
jgi:hypothetical protein